jgi:hypothetical protein
MALNLCDEFWMVFPYSFTHHQISVEEHRHLYPLKPRAQFKWYTPPLRFRSNEKLLWRISDNYFTKDQFEECLLWANLAYHELLRQSSSNDAKILRFESHFRAGALNTRRIIRCLIDLERPGEARDLLEQIHETPPHALTCVLQFQVAVINDSEEMGSNSYHLGKLI